MKKSEEKRPLFATVGIFFQTIYMVLRSLLEKSLFWRFLPVLLALLALSIILALASTAPILAPFVYTLF